MVGLDDRKRVVGYILEAVKSGASKMRACETVELNMRTFQRWFDWMGLQRHLNLLKDSNKVKRKRSGAMFCSLYFHFLTPASD